jgi:hypothetical protein
VLTCNRAALPIKKYANLTVIISVLGEKTMRRTVCYSAIAAMIPEWLLAVAIIISAVHFSFAQAQDNTKKGKNELAMACGNELKKQCSGMPVQENKLLICLQQSEKTLSRRCAALATNVVSRCDRDAARLCQGVVTGKGNIIECLTTAKRSVSSRCNAAIDAAFLR